MTPTTPSIPSRVLESLIPSIQPKWKRSVVTSSLETSSSETECQVCLEQKSRYCCPKCSIAYCSLACYKSHGETCTETFYQDKVSKVLELERNDTDGGDRGAIQEILNRVHQQQSEADEYYEEIKSTEELEELMEALEKGDGKDLELSPELQAAFERDVQAGKLNDLVVQPWSPWWESSLVVNEDDELTSDNLGPSLDERLLKIPPFSQLRAKEASPCLPFNLVSILRSICQTLRLYGGCNNVKANSLCQEAAELIVHNSQVLASNDVRYESLQQLLMENNQEGKNHQGNGDMVAVLAHHRHVSHALFDGIAIFKAAEKETSQDDESDKSDRQGLRRIRKKLEFYLSWSRGLDLRAVSNEVQRWTDEWKLTHEIESLRLS
jgi:hypothetical protein